MSDTMDDIQSSEADLDEVSAEEKALIAHLRSAKIPAAEITKRIAAAQQRAGSPAPRPESKPASPDEETVTVGQAKRMLQEYAQGQEAKAVRGKIQERIGNLVAESGVAGNARRCGRLSGEIFETISQREDLTTLTDDAFDKVLVEETGKAIKAEREEIMAIAGHKPGDEKPPAKPEPSQTAAEKLGEREPTGEPAPRSEVGSDSDDHVRPQRVTAKNLDSAFGADVDWNIQDAEVEMKTSALAQDRVRRAEKG